MKEILVSEKNALLETENNYIVAVGYDKETKSWAFGHYFNFWERKELKPFALFNAIEYLRYAENNYYISRDRIIEIASAAIQNLDEIEMEYFIEDAMIEDYEKEFFGIEESEVE